MFTYVVFTKARELAPEVLAHIPCTHVLTRSVQTCGGVQLCACVRMQAIFNARAAWQARLAAHQQVLEDDACVRAHYHAAGCVQGLAMEDLIARGLVFSTDCSALMLMEHRRSEEIFTVGGCGSAQRLLSKPALRAHAPRAPAQQGVGGSAEVGPHCPEPALMAACCLCQGGSTRAVGG